ncbi:MAG: FAD-dependent oxidoreductase, partial [Candidatus Bipolaricaulota bacterium]
MGTRESPNGTVGAALVVGAGIGGMQAALDLANSGFKVFLLERQPAIGGAMAQLDKTFPTNDCAMCTLAPRLVEVGRHEDIELLTLCEIESIEGRPGDFRVRIRRRPRYVDPEKCTGCGDCEADCPVCIDNGFDSGLSRRKAIYRPYAQAYPNAYAIDKRLFAPCRNACPAGANVPGFVALIAERKFDEALELYRQRNPFPATCGRICDHECQEACNREQLDDAVAIRDLHRFLADREIGAARQGHAHPQVAGPAARGQEVPGRGGGRGVAIVGAGPAGLTCAWDLANMGYAPVVFESLEVAGGMLRVGVPRYRLPDEVLDYEIEAIKRAGVEIRLETPVGADLTLHDLFDQGFEAIFLAVGTHGSRTLGVSGEEMDGVTHGTEFLHRAKREQAADVADRTVVVIGGGDVAIDAARTAVRLCAKEVHLACLESAAEMPGDPEAIKAAEEEGVTIHHRLSPKRIVGRRGQVTGVEFRECLSVFDEAGTFCPVVKADPEQLMAADSVVVAIGQAVDWELLSAADKRLEAKAGLLSVNPETMATSVPGVFAGGDVVSGPDVAVRAIVAGHRASASIDRFLNAEEMIAGEVAAEPTEAEEDLAPVPEGRHTKQRRVVAPVLSAADRILGFPEVELGYSEEQAVAEARRCMHCTVCSECRECEKACGADAVDHGQTDDYVDLHVGAIIAAPGFVS